VSFSVPVNFFETTSYHDKYSFYNHPIQEQYASKNVKNCVKITQYLSSFSYIFCEGFDDDLHKKFVPLISIYQSYQHYVHEDFFESLENQKLYQKFKNLVWYLKIHTEAEL